MKHCASQNQCSHDCLNLNSKATYIVLRDTLKTNMIKKFPPAPPSGTPMLLTRPSPQARTLLALRRSAGSKMLMAPGPSSEALDELLNIAARVPDHRKLEPWRFIVFEGKSRAAFHCFIPKYKAQNAHLGTRAIDRCRVLQFASGRQRSRMGRCLAHRMACL